MSFASRNIIEMSLSLLKTDESEPLRI